MKNKLLADALMMIVLSMLPNKLVAAEATADRSTEQKPFSKRTCEHARQLIPVLMGHTDLAQFALRGLQFPDEAPDPVESERVSPIQQIQQSLRLNILRLNRGEAMCSDSMHRIAQCPLSTLHSISL